MNDAFSTFLAQFWQFVQPLGVLAWSYLQPIYADAPSSLLVGIAIGLVLSQMLRGFLMVAFVCTFAFFALRMLGISI